MKRVGIANRLRFDEEGAVADRFSQLLAQPIGYGTFVLRTPAFQLQQQCIAQRKVLEAGQCTREMLYLLRGGKLEQPAQALVRRLLRAMLRVQQLQAHAVAIVYQRRVADQRLPAASEFDLLG